MVIQPTEEQRKIFQALSQQSQGKVLKEYVKTMLTALADVRNIPEGKEDAHRIATKLIDENLLRRLEGKVVENTISSYE